jgi:hypothetical protein
MHSKTCNTIFFSILLLLGYSNISSQKVQKFAQLSDFQLAKPQIIYDQILFESENEIFLLLDNPGVEIRYSLDGTNPTSNSNLYRGPIKITQSTHLKALATHSEYQKSETAEMKFIQHNKKITAKSIQMDREPHQNYPGSGPESLMDLQKGTTNFRTSHWMGFDGGDLVVTIELAEKMKVNKVITSLIFDPGSWIFLPAEILVYLSKNGKKYKLAGMKALDQATPESTSGLEFISTAFKTKKSKFIQMQIKSMSSIPDWHQGKGTPPWLFIDEIIIE